MTLFKKSFAFGDRQATLEYGEIGRQADAAVLVSVEDTVVLVAVTSGRDAKPDASFLPLTVDYQEKYYAAGRIPGGFLRREGRPTDKEILTSRLIDRSIRPLFPGFFYHEVQVLASVLSFNPEINPDIPAMLGELRRRCICRAFPLRGRLARRESAVWTGRRLSIRRRARWKILRWIWWWPVAATGC